MQTVPAYDLKTAFKIPNPRSGGGRWCRRPSRSRNSTGSFRPHSAGKTGTSLESAVWSRWKTRVIVGPDEAAEEIDAEPASGVVLPELLDAERTGPADLEYEYDFGDAWTHTVEVMGRAELPEKTFAAPTAPTAGRWRIPADPTATGASSKSSPIPRTRNIRMSPVVRVRHGPGPRNLRANRVRNRRPQRPAGRAGPAALAGAAHGRRD